MPGTIRHHVVFICFPSCRLTCTYDVKTSPRGGHALVYGHGCRCQNDREMWDEARKCKTAGLARLGDVDELECCAASCVRI